METLVAHAFGRKQLKECGVTLYRSMLFGTLLFVPMTICVYFAEPMLIAMKIDPVVAKYARNYCMVWLPGNLLHFYGDAICCMCACMGFTSRQFWFQFIAVPLQVLCCWLFVSKLDLGIVGAALSGTILSFVHFIGMMLVAWSYQGVRPALVMPTRQVFSNLNDLIKLALPGSIMILVECLNWDTLALFSGMFGNDYLAAEVIII